MISLILWIIDFLTTITDKKLDVIIRGIEILKAYAEKNITNEEQRQKWETEVKSWIEQIWEARVNADYEELQSMGEAGRYFRDLMDRKEGANEVGKYLGEGMANERELNEASASVIKEFFTNIWKGFTRLFEKYPPSSEVPHIPLGREDYPSNGSVVKGEREKSDTTIFLFQQISDKIDALTARIPLIENAKADELSGADKQQATLEGGKTADNAVLLDEMKLQKESITTQITNAKSAITETRDAVATVDERVKNIAALLDERARKMFREEYERSWTKPTDMDNTRDRHNITIRYRPKDSV